MIKNIEIINFQADFNINITIGDTSSKPNILLSLKNNEILLF